MLTGLRRLITPALLALAGVALLAAPSRAEFLLSAGTLQADPGSSGFLDITLTNTSATDQTLSGFSVALMLAAPDVTLTGVDSLTAAPYVFGTEGTGTLTFDSFPNLGFTLSDVSLSPNGSVLLLAGQTYGLGRIAFSVGANAPPGLRELTFVTGPLTQFVDANQDVYPDALITIQTGGVNVTGVPEPSSVMMVLAAMGVVIPSRRLWRAIA